MILSQKKIGNKFFETLSRNLNSLIENNKNAFEWQASMIFPQLLLCKTKYENYGSLSRTEARRLKQLQKIDLDDLCN